MSHLKMVISACVLFVVSLALPVGNAFATTCSLPCSFPIPAACEDPGDTASFELFSPSATIYSGAVCHPNTNFEFHVTTSAFNQTPSGYYFEDLPGVYTYDGTFVSGHPYYEIKFKGEYDPGNVSSDMGFIELTFVNNDHSMKPEIEVEVFDENDNPIFSDILSPPTTYPLGASFSVTANVLTIASKISRVEINTKDKHGLVSVRFSQMSFDNLTIK